MPRIFIGICCLPRVASSSPALTSRVRLSLYRDTMHMYRDTVKSGAADFAWRTRAAMSDLRATAQGRAVRTADWRTEEDGEGRRPRRAGDRARGERFARAGGQAGGPEPRADRQGGRAGALDGAAHRRGACRRGFRRRGAAGTRRAHRPGSRAHRRFARLQCRPRSCIRISIALRDEVGETVDLSILSGGSAVFIDQIPGTAAARRAIRRSASAFRLHCTANGKAILACFSRRGRRGADRQEPRRASRARAPDRAKLVREIEAVRRKHLAFDLGEHGIGISAVGVAMRRRVRPAGRGLDSRADPTLRRAARRIVDGAARVSRQDARARRALSRRGAASVPRGET